MKKKQIKGFTLVEMIVVIAIIAVLAAILVPSLLGYVKKAKLSAANRSARTLYDATMTACRENDVIKPIPEGLYTGTDEPTGADGDTFRKYVYEYFAKAEDTEWGAWIESDCPTGTALRKSESDPYIGTYPKTNNENKSGETIENAVDYARGENVSW